MKSSRAVIDHQYSGDELETCVCPDQRAPRKKRNPSRNRDWPLREAATELVMLQYVAPSDSQKPLRRSQFYLYDATFTFTASDAADYEAGTFNLAVRSPQESPPFVSAMLAHVCADAFLGRRSRMAMMAEDEAAARGFRRLSSLFLPPQSNANKCQRCKVTVYQQERMGPVHDVVFHKTCFRCIICGQFLTLKNYWSNQVDGNDAEIYCHTHVPRIGGSGMDREALGIKRAMAAQQDVSSGALSKLNQMRGVGGAPTMDGDALAIRSAVSAQKKWESGQQAQVSHTANVDASALHIKGALDAQRLQRRYQRKLDKHHYPPHIAKKREELFDAQKRLEERLRQEEDELFKAFHEERQVTKSAITREIDQEWEQRLRELTEKYGVNDKKKSKKIKDGDKKLMTVQFETEKKDLEKKMTLKREKITKTATLRLREKEQRATSDMVKKQSMEMLRMLAAKQEEIKKELQKTMAFREEGPPPSVHEAPKQNGVSHNAHNVPTPEVTSSGGNSSEELLQEALEDVLLMPAVARPISPHPPCCRKNELFPDASVFGDIDEQVIKVAEGEQPTYTDLVRLLTENLVTELEKVRAIYRWITVKDLNVMEFADNIDAESPMGLLRGIKFGTETYHVLFMRLCSYAGLHCVEIKGHSKSVGYEPGMKITPETFQNTWNAVLIAGDWRLIQCNWGASMMNTTSSLTLTSSSRSSGRTTPSGSCWRSPSPWRSLRLSPSSDPSSSTTLAVVDADEKGGCKISIKIPEEYENDLVFYYQLRFADKDRLKDLTYKGSSLERFVFQTMVDNTVTFSVHVPTPADYFLEIFANKIDESSRIEENNTNMHPLPNCAAGEWGPKKALRHFGITPILSEGATGDGERVGIIMAEDKFRLRFKLPRPLQFVAKLRMNQVEEKTLDPFVQLLDENNILSISVSLPQQGQYGLDIYARPKSAADTSTLSHACKYLINCTKVTDPVDIPKVPEQSRRNKWGPTPVFEMYGLELVSHKEPKIRMGGNSSTCCVELHVPQGVQLSYQFLREPDEDNRDYVVATRDPANAQTVRYQVTLPKPGNYMLCLYARRDDSEDRSLPNVYNYLLQYMPEAENDDPSPPSTNRTKGGSSIFKKG
ncbi:hypothetical protein BaRGS_00023535, partial [Batillaria attramentaria]